MIKNNGKIYKYTNLINGKIYIGQTTNTLEKRDRRHIQDSKKDHLIFHCALVKYGRENFSLELLEENIDTQHLDNREKFWIDYYESFYKTGKGYNMNQGGKWSSGTQILTISQAREIQQRLIHGHDTFKIIAEEYGVTIYAISDINRGHTFVNDTLDYPLRKRSKRSILNTQKVMEIINLLKNTTLNFAQIAEQMQCNEFTIGSINRGQNSWCPKNIKYPIRTACKEYTYNNILTADTVVKVIHEMLFTNDPLKDIGKKYNVARGTLGDISRGLSWKTITQNFKLPIIANRITNQKIYQSIYGIV